MTSADGCPSLYTKMMHKIKTQKSQLIFILKVMFSADYIEAENAQYADIHLNLRNKKKNDLRNWAPQIWSWISLQVSSC